MNSPGSFHPSSVCCKEDTCQSSRLACEHSLCCLWSLPGPLGTWKGAKQGSSALKEALGQAVSCVVMLLFWWWVFWVLQASSLFCWWKAFCYPYVIIHVTSQDWWALAAIPPLDAREIIWRVACLRLSETVSVVLKVLRNTLGHLPHCWGQPLCLPPWVSSCVFLAGGEGESLWGKRGELVS